MEWLKIALLEKSHQGCMSTGEPNANPDHSQDVNSNNNIINSSDSLHKLDYGNQSNKR